MKKLRKALIPITAMILLFSICTITGCSSLARGIDFEKESRAHEAFIEALGGVSETYVGAVSDHTYSSQDDAARAYISDQIMGDNYDYNLNLSLAETLTEEQIAALQLTGEDALDIQSVEAIDVTISPDNTMSTRSGLTQLATLNTEKTVKVYIIKYSSDYKYFSPRPVTGDTITKSYYDSVFNSDKYKNCTYTSVTTMDEEIALFGFLKVGVEIVTKQTIRYAENAIYIEQTTEASLFGGESSKIYAYVLQDEYGDLTCYVSTDGEEYGIGNLSTVGFYSLEELTPFYDQYLDYTYFTKTDYGFELANENAREYVNEVMSEFDTSSMSNIDIEMFAKYYVQEGSLFGTRMEIYLDFTMPTDDGSEANVGAAAVIEQKITDCGTTVVELPFEVDR